MDDNKMISLYSIMEEFQERYNGDRSIAYKRFKKLMEYLNTSMDELKNDSKKISFHEDEKEFVLALINEMREPYLSKITAKKSLATTMPKELKMAVEFEKKMYEVIARMKNEQLKSIAYKSVDLLSKRKSRELILENKEKMDAIAKVFIKGKLYEEEFNQELERINKAMDDYYLDLVKRFGDRERK